MGKEAPVSRPVSGLSCSVADPPCGESQKALQCKLLAGCMPDARWTGCLPGPPLQGVERLKSRQGFLGLALAATFATVALAGCGTSTSAPAPSPTWATVNGHPISKAEVVTRIDIVKVLSPQAASQLKLRSTYVSVAQELASEYLIIQAAKAAKVTTTKQQVSSSQSQFHSYLLSLHGTSAALNKALKAAGVSTAAVNAYAAEAALFQNFFQKFVTPPTVTAKQISAYYQTYISQFQQPAQYDLRHILVKTQALADTLLQELKGGASFSALAKKYSIDKGSAAKGGDLGYAPLSAYVAPFAAAAQKLTKTNQLSPVVHSKYGYHIIQLLGIKAASTQSLSSVSSQIQTFLQQQALQSAEQAYVTKMTAKATVKLKVPTKVP